MPRTMTNPASRADATGGLKPPRRRYLSGALEPCHVLARCGAQETAGQEVGFQQQGDTMSGGATNLRGLHHQKEILETDKHAKRSKRMQQNIQICLGIPLNPLVHHKFTISSPMNMENS